MSCFGDSTGPGERRRAGLAFHPVFNRQAALGIVDFNRVHITLTRPGTTPPQTALDTTVDFPADADSLRLPLTVQLSPGSTTEPFDLVLEMITAAGSVVFRGGPVTVTATAGVLGGQAPDIPMRYVGVGYNAAGVRFRAPVPFTAFFGDTAVFAAEAYDSAGTAIAGTPIVYSVDAADTAKASVPNPAQGRVVVKPVRGPAAIVVQLLTGQTARTSLLVQPRPTAIAATGGSGQSGPVHAALAQPITVRVTGADGLGVQGVVVTFAVTTGGGSLSATVDTTDASGNVTTVWTLGTAPGSQSVTASAGTLTTTPITAAATAGAATLLVFTVQPTNVNANVAIAPAVQVAAQDSFSNTVTTYTGSVTLAIGTNPSSGTLSGTVSVAAVAGVATFSTLKVDSGGAAYTLVASATGLPSAASAAFNVNGGRPTKLAFLVQPTNTVAGASVTPAVQVAIQDVNGTTVPSRTDTVTLALGTNPGADTLVGNLKVAAVAGVATFSSVSLRRAAAGYTLTASLTGLTSATSSSFTIGVAAASILSLASGGSQFASPGTQLPQPVVVRVTDAYGNGVAGRTVTFAIATGGGSIGTASAPTDATGSASTTWTLGTGGGAQTITASSSGMSGSPLTITASSQIGAPAKLTFLVQPSNTVAGRPITPAVQVVAQDSNGITVPSYTGQLGIILSTNPDTAVLSGTILVNAVAGVATFSTLSVNKAGAGYALGAISATLEPAFSTTFTITAGAAKSLAVFSGVNQTGPASTLLAQPIVVKVADSLGNGVSGVAVVFAVATGGGSVGTSSATTNANGQASTTWTLGVASGAQTITATSAGLVGSPLTITGTAGAVVASTTVTPHLDTLTALGTSGNFHVVAQAKDGSGTAMAGHFTWVSRNLTYVTVDTTGVVTGLANGSAWVVATETGGTMDSALIVVQQRMATILVTPGTRSIYLSGHFAFAASAVDGGGTPIPTQPTFTWSTTAPAVATVDTAGHVVGVGLGVAQIRATSGLVIGVANISVLTPITRIAVLVDSVGATRTDTATLVSLGITRRYRAVAHDTLDAVMTGIPFAFVSTNGSVAQLVSFANDTATVVSAANGVTNVNATAQGFTSNPGAQLIVQQVLAAIALTPPAPQIAVTGTVGLVARGLDANGRYISGGSFIFHSATPAVAIVDSVTGRVTGVTLGTANITATSGAITSNPAVVTVTTTVPPVISFGRDTVSVGRGSSASIPILLSTPSAAALTVNLGRSPAAFAHWSAASVVISAGQTAVNATLVGDSAGTTIVTATDGSGLGYAAGSAVAKVTANMHLASSSYAINTTDIVTTQVLLSDPSPAGGTYVAFSYGTAGIASISPDPAFIPAGQLAADIQIRAIGAGTSSITPTAIGVNGTASSFTAYAPVLTISQTAIRLGLGQYSPDAYVYLPMNSNLAVTVNVASSNDTVATVPATATIPAGNYYVLFTTTARATGTATISVSAPGWTSARTMLVTVTTPALGLYGGGSLYTTSPAQNVTVYAEDSTRTSHYRVNSLAVHLASRDTAVMKVLDTVVTIAPGAYYNNAGRVAPGALGGTTWVVATASGHAPDSVQYTVLGPPLTLGWGTNRIGAGQEDYSLYVYTPNAVVVPLVVTLAHSDSTRTGTPTSVTIPTGSSYGYFTVRGKNPGVDTIRATAPGFQATSATYIVTSPRLFAYGDGTYNQFGTGGGITVYEEDSVGTSHYRSSPLVVTIVSTDTTIAKVDSATVRIDSGSYYNGHARILPVGLGTARIILSAAGHLAPDTLTVTVSQPRIRFSIRNVNLGRRQYYPAGSFYVYTPDYRPSPLIATITQLHGTVDSVASKIDTIATSGSYAYYGAVYGLALGTDTLVVTAPGYLPDTSFVTVSTPKLFTYGLPGTANTTSPAIGVTVYATDSLGNSHTVMDTLVVRAVSSDSNVLRPLQPYFRLPKDAYYASTKDTVMGPGTASVTFSDSAGTGYLPATTNTITVTGPVLTLSNGTPVLGMRQTGGQSSAYVYTPNYVTAPLVVHLHSTGTQVVTVPDSVVVPTNSNSAYFPVTAMDTVGTIQVQATALGYGAAAMTVQVTVPKLALSTTTQLNTTSGRRTLTLIATDATGNSHYVTEPVTVTLLSSAPSVAAIDSTTVTIPAGASYVTTANWTPGQVGTARLSAIDPRAARYAYITGTIDVSVVQPTLGFSWATSQLGIGQYDNQYVYTPDYQASALAVALAHAATPRTSITVGGTAVTGVTIPAGTSSTYFHVVGTSTGTDTLVATATSPAHFPVTGYVIVGPGRVDPLGSWPTSLRVGDSVLVYLSSRDAITNTHNVVAATTFTLAPTGNIQFVSGGSLSAVITSVTIAADASYVPFYVKGVTAAGVGGGTITQANYQTYVLPSVTVSP